MARTVLAYVPAALLLAWNWLRLEYPRVSFWQAVWIVTLALVPALVRSWRARLALGVLAFVAAAHSAFGLSPFDARPFSEHDYFGPLVSRFTNGFLDFYDVQLPFDRYEQARM